MTRGARRWKRNRPPWASSSSRRTAGARASMLSPGRSCPTSYRYGPDALRGAPSLHADSLWIAGGLYGNPFALEALLEAYEREPGRKALVFNGDFHWFDVDAGDFGRINDAVLAFHAPRGNVETELATPQDGA